MKRPLPKRLKMSSGETSGTIDFPLKDEGGSELLGPKRSINKIEFVRILAKALQSLGYEKTEECLELESGIRLHSPGVTSFVKHVLDGSWDESVATLSIIGLLDEATINVASLMLLEQKFFELLDENKYVDALRILRCEITPRGANSERVKQLTSCFIFPSNNFLTGATAEDIPKQNLRLDLLVKLQRVFPQSVMIADNRLVELVEQSIGTQVNACAFHNAKVEEISLLTDHICGSDKLPRHTSQILCAHRDEVWFLQFSHDGKYLASASKDATVIVWEVKADDEVVLKNILRGHQKPVFFVSWSPDNKQLLSCGVEEVVRRWDVFTGKCDRVYMKDNVGMVSCGWAPDGKSVYAGVNDRSIIMWSLEGDEIECKQGLATIEISDLGILSNMGVLAVSKDNAVVVVDLLVDVEQNMNPRNVIQELLPIVSFSLSGDKKSLLVNLLDQEIHLWDISGNVRLMRTYRGHKHSRFVVRSCFGGVDQAFVASGSEDSQVYIWRRKTGELIRTLAGHTGTVNSVSWNPERPLMLASASDDGSIRIWGLKKVEIELGDLMETDGDGGHQSCGTSGLK